jgi:DNA repair exonuclease SbcCD ATPase subunit
MITFKSVEISNFLSYGQKPTVIDLDETGSVLIVGNNEDVGEQGSSKNGAGKSSSMQAILFALYGKGHRINLKQMSSSTSQTERNYRLLYVSRKPEKSMLLPESVSHHH